MEERKRTKLLETSFYDHPNYIAEQVYDPVEESSSFAIHNKKNGIIDYEPHLFVRESKAIPINSKALEGTVLLPSKAMEYGSEEELLAEIRDYIHTYLDIGNEMETFASYYILLSWVYDRFNTVPYLRALGDTGTGKTRYLDVIGRICYKPIITSGATTVAPIFRLLEKWRGTMVMDEADFSKSDTRQDIIKIFNTGFERGKPVIRCDKNNPKEIEHHNVFGTKVLATRETFTDKALESRCLTVVMRETNRKDIPINLTKVFYDKQQELRNKLLMYRFRNREKIIERANFDIDGLEPRLRQMANPFAVLFSENETLTSQFTNFIREYQTELIEERAGSWEGMIANAVYQLREEGEEVVSAQTIQFHVKDNYGEDIGIRKIGKILRSLGFDRKNKRNNEGKVVKGIVWDEELLERIGRRFVANVASVASYTETGDKRYVAKPKVKQCNATNATTLHNSSLEIDEIDMGECEK